MMDVQSVRAFVNMPRASGHSALVVLVIHEGHLALRQEYLARHASHSIHSTHTFTFRSPSMDLPTLPTLPGLGMPCVAAAAVLDDGGVCRCPRVWASDPVVTAPTANAALESLHSVSSVSGSWSSPASSRQKAQMSGSWSGVLARSQWRHFPRPSHS